MTKIKIDVRLLSSDQVAELLKHADDRDRARTASNEVLTEALGDAAIVAALASDPVAHATFTKAVTAWIVFNEKATTVGDSEIEPIVSGRTEADTLN